MKLQSFPPLPPFHLFSILFFHLEALPSFAFILKAPIPLHLI